MTDLERAGSFGDDAWQYDRARPSYPAAMVDDLVAGSVRRVLDVGCGTGIASRLFVARGCVVVGVERDPRMAEVARGHGIDARVVAFEDWSPEGEPPFDLVVSAQAWHWIDPRIGPVRAAEGLRPGGRFAAIWTSYEHAADVLDEMRPIYAEFAPSLWEGSIALGLVTPEARAAARRTDREAIAAPGLFREIDEWSYPWTRRYSGAAWVDELVTHSTHRTAGDRERVDELVARVRRMIDTRGGIDVAFTTRVLTALKS